ncbi:MAG: hypothetical protein HPY52_10645 [Firmicutes bacterium]|nr:hypothetical protein [Bacillota bacterium]
MGRRLSWDEIKAAAYLVVAYIDLLDRGLPQSDYQAWRARGERIFAPHEHREPWHVTIGEIMRSKGVDLERILGVAA